MGVSPFWIPVIWGWCLWREGAGGKMGQLFPRFLKTYKQLSWATVTAFKWYSRTSWSDSYTYDCNIWQPNSNYSVLWNMHNRTISGFLIHPSLVLHFYQFRLFSWAVISPFFNTGRWLFINTEKLCPSWATFKNFHSHSVQILFSLGYLVKKIIL